MNLFQLTELMLNKQRALNTKDICSTCGHVYIVANMTDLTQGMIRVWCMNVQNVQLMGR